MIRYCSERDVLKAELDRMISESPAIQKIDEYIAELRRDLDRANDANDQYLSTRDPHYLDKLNRYRSEVQKLEVSDKKKQKRPKDEYRDYRRKERIGKIRKELDETLLAHSSELPHPIEPSRIKPDSILTPSIQILKRQVSESNKGRKSLIKGLRSQNRPFPNSEQFEILSTEIRQFLQTRSNPDQRHVYELECTFEEAEDIAIDHRGYPIDAHQTPISIETRIIRYAIESKDIVLDEQGQFAYVTEASALVGTVFKKEAHLVIITRRQLDEILRFEDQLQPRIDELLHHSYQNQADEAFMSIADEKIPTFEEEEIHNE